MPIEMKNTLARASRNGSTSAAIRDLRSDSARISPARNAPSASERPAHEVSHALPSVTSTTPNRNASRERERDTRASSHGTARRATANASATTASRVSERSAVSAGGPAVPGAAPAATPAYQRPSHGTATANGITIRSWKTRMPVTSRPCGDESSSRSVRSFSTSAVLESASNDPKKRARAGCRPAAASPPPTSATVSSTCSTPARMAPRPMRPRSVSENSSPTVKSSSTTPNSARVRTSSASRISPRPPGPMSTPVTMKPTTAGSRRRRNSMTTASETPASISSSRRTGISWLIAPSLRWWAARRG